MQNVSENLRYFQMSSSHYPYIYIYGHPSIYIYINLFYERLAHTGVLYPATVSIIIHQVSSLSLHVSIYIYHILSHFFALAVLYGALSKVLSAGRNTMRSRWLTLTYLSGCHVRKLQTCNLKCSQSGDHFFPNPWNLKSP